MTQMFGLAAYGGRTIKRAWRPGVLLSVMAAIPGPAAPARWGSADFEAEVFAALNDARTAPALQAESLEAYRLRFRGKIVTMPGTTIAYRTREGVAPVDEALAFLSRVAARPELAPSPILAAAAADHAREQRASGRTGHVDADGSGPSERVRRRGGGRAVAEVITYGSFDAAAVVRQLIIDDGVPDRGHRGAIFAGHLRYAGVACGSHPRYRTMCVIDMADTPDGRSPGPFHEPQVAFKDF